MAAPVPAQELDPAELARRLEAIPGGDVANPPQLQAPIEEPPAWNEIKNSEEYKALNFPDQINLARKWGEEAKAYASTLPDFTNSQAKQIDDFVASEAVDVPANVKRAALEAGLIKGLSSGLGAIAGGAGGAIVGGPVGGFAGAIGGMVAGGELAEAGMRKFVPAVSEARKYAPGYATAGEYAPTIAMGAAGGARLVTSGKVLARELGTKKAAEEIAKTAAVAGGVGGVVGTGARAVTGGEITPRTVAEDVLFNALFSGLSSGARIQGYNREQALNLNERVKAGRASETEFRDWQGILAEAERTQARWVESAKRTEVELGGRPVFQRTELTQRPQPEVSPVPTAELPAPKPQVPELPEAGVRGLARGTQADTAEMQRRGVTSEMQETLLDLNDPVPVRKTFTIESQGINRETIIPDTRGLQGELVSEGPIVTPRTQLPTTKRLALPVEGEFRPTKKAEEAAKVIELEKGMEERIRRSPQGAYGLKTELGKFAVPQQVATELSAPVGQPNLSVVIGNQVVGQVETFREASIKYSAVRNESGIGSRDLPDAKLVDESGKIVARVAYNGSVFPGDKWFPGIKPLYVPTLDELKASLKPQPKQPLGMTEKQSLAEAERVQAEMNLTGQQLRQKLELGRSAKGKSQKELKFEIEQLQAKKDALEGKRQYVSMQNFIQSVGRDELGDILVNSPFDGSVSDDGKSIVSFADPRNQKGKIRVGSKEFFDWLNSDKVYEGLKFEGSQDRENYVRYVEDLRAKSIKGGGSMPRPLRRKTGEAGFIISDPAEKARAIAQRWATSRGDLPKEAFDILEAKDERIQAMQKQIDFTLRDLSKASIEANGKRVLTEPQKAIIDSYIRGQSDVLAELPESMQAPVAQIRRQIDNLTDRLIESGALSGAKAEVALARKGEYITRSYEKYDNPRFGFDLLQKRNPARLESAIRFLQQEITNADPTLSQAEARQLAIGKAREISTPEEGFSFDSLVNAANLGKDLSITKARKNIPEEIRFLLGEYEDPIINYARTAVKMINLLQSQRTLTSLRDWGVRNNLFFERPTGEASQIIAAEGSKTLEPLNGLYATPELVKAIKDFDVMVKGGDAYKMFSAINAWVKWGKTVGSVQAQFRNPLSNIAIEIMNGNFAFTGNRQALNTILSEFGVPAVDSPEMRRYVTRATQLGILDTTVLNEFYQTLRDAQRYKGDTMSFAEDLSGRSMNAAKKGITFLNRLYRSGDNFFKVMAWESEIKALMNGRGISRQEAEVEAAERVKNTRPTYSRVFRIVKKWRNQPLFGNFISWPSEILRITGNNIRYAAKDFNTPGMRLNSMKRLVGTIAVSALGTAIARAFMWATDFNDRKVEAVRRFVAPYQKNATLAPTGIDKNGDVGYIDISYTDPFEVFRGPIIAAASGRDPEEGILNATREFLETYLGPSILVNSLASAIYGRTPQNKEIRNPQDPALDQAYDTLTYLLRQNEPATVSQMRRVYKALRGEPDVNVSKYGRIYKPGEEISAIFGIRPQSINLSKALEGKSARFASNMSDVGRIFTETYGAVGTVPESTIRSQYAKMEDRRRKLFDEANIDFHAAMLLGMDKGEAIRAMSIGMGRANAIAVANNRYRDYKIGRSLRQQMQRNLTQEEIQKREAIRRDIEMGIE
jgi:hypothetical protein